MIITFCDFYTIRLLQESTLTFRLIVSIIWYELSSYYFFGEKPKICFEQWNVDCTYFLGGNGFCLLMMSFWCGSEMYPLMYPSQIKFAMMQWTSSVSMSVSPMWWRAIRNAYKIAFKHSIHRSIKPLVTCTADYHKDSFTPQHFLNPLSARIVM